MIYASVVAVAQLHREAFGQSGLGDDGFKFIEIGVATVWPDGGIDRGQIEFTTREITGLRESS
ncbi:MAG: hypothetical protein EBU32_08000, partial [Opitutaceae bacterium]|nr:hypothetical protein [Opitutaceae bacterium]